MICKCGCPEDNHTKEWGCATCNCNKFRPVIDEEISVAHGWQDILVEIKDEDETLHKKQLPKKRK